MDFIFKYILPNSTIKVAQYTYPLLTLPGVFVVGNQTYRVSDNDKYNAPIVVLVNEGNQSAAETSVQVIQCNPNTQTIGSQSAGANGNISEFILPPRNTRRIFRVRVVLSRRMGGESAGREDRPRNTADPRRYPGWTGRNVGGSTAPNRREDRRRVGRAGHRMRNGAAGIQSAAPF